MEDERQWRAPLTDGRSSELGQVVKQWTLEERLKIGAFQAPVAKEIIAECYFSDGAVVKMALPPALGPRFDEELLNAIFITLTLQRRGGPKARQAMMPRLKNIP